MIKLYFGKLMLLITIILLTTVNAHSQNKKMVVAAYWHGRAASLDSFDLNKITHLIFCFGHLDGTRYKIDNARDSALIEKMVSLKSVNPKMKVILSLGGWGGCETCSDAFFTKKGRRDFAKSVRQVNRHFKTDGIDLDWEYPTVRLDNDIYENPVHKTAPEDKEHFTDLVKRLRKVLGRRKTISFAAGGFQTFLDKAVDWEKVMKKVDYVNLMTYDLVNGYATVTGHHTALYSTPSQRESTDNAVQFLIKKKIDPKKIIVGSAFYARAWENVDSVNNGLYQDGRFKFFIPYKQFSSRLSPELGFKYYWDSTAKAPYMYSDSLKTFATFDDARSMEIKTKYVAEHQLGGIMFWELSLDLLSGGLLDAIDRARKEEADGQ